MLRNTEHYLPHGGKKKYHIKIKFSIVSRTINTQKSLKAFLICPQSCSVTDMFLPKDTNF